MTKKKILSLLSLSAAFVGLSTMASAQFAITGPVTEGTGVTVSGTSFVPNGAIELWINGESAGSVQSDGAGAWSTTADLTAGDEMFISASQVWDFKTGVEGWYAGGDDAVSVDTNGDGVLTITNSGTDPNLTFALGDGSAAVGVYNPNQTRVIEIRYRITSGSYDHVAAGGQSAFYLNGPNFPADVVNFGTQNVFTNVGVGNFNTVLIAADLDGYNLSGTNGTTWSADSINQLVFGSNGFAAGDTLEVDFVRLHEYYNFDFDDDGDTMGFIPGSEITNPSVTSSVTTTGGELVITAGGAGTASIDLEGFSFINAPYYNVVETSVSTNLPFAGGAGFNLEYYSWNGSYNPAGFAIQLYNNDGTSSNTFQISPTGSEFGADWIANPVLLDGFAGTPQSTDFDFMQAFFPSGAGESINFDYIRFRPGPVSGPSATETVLAGSSVRDWMIMD